MSLTTFTAGTKAKASEVNNNNTYLEGLSLVAVQPNFVAVSGSTSSGTYTAIQTININASDKCSAAFWHLFYEFNPTLGVGSNTAYFKIKITFNDASTVDNIDEVSANDNNSINLYNEINSYVAPAGKYITKIEFFGKASTSSAIITNQGWASGTSAPYAQQSSALRKSYAILYKHV